MWILPKRIGKNHYRMYSYATEVLPAITAANSQSDSKKESIMGHSMGGLGALICALKNLGKYVSVFAFCELCCNNVVYNL